MNQKRGIKYVNSAFPNTCVRSLNPKFDWREPDIRNLLHELSDDSLLRRVLPTNKITKGRDRLKKLKWIILTDIQSVKASRALFDDFQKNEVEFELDEDYEDIDATLHK